MMHYVKSGNKRRRRQLEHLAQKMQKLFHYTLENYLLNSTSVCVCVCARARACVRVHVSPLISFYGNGQ